MTGFGRVASLAAGVVLAGCSGQADGTAAVHAYAGAQDNVMKSNGNPAGTAGQHADRPAAVSGPLADTPAEAEGRRTLSTAFVRLGAGERLTVELRDGRTVVLRDVAMGPRDYCGVQVGEGAVGTRYCGGYGEIVAARTGS